MQRQDAPLEPKQKPWTGEGALDLYAQAVFKSVFGKTRTYADPTPGHAVAATWSWLFVTCTCSSECISRA